MRGLGGSRVFKPPIGPPSFQGQVLLYLHQLLLHHNLLLADIQHIILDISGVLVLLQGRSPWRDGDRVGTGGGHGAQQWGALRHFAFIEAAVCLLSRVVTVAPWGHHLLLAHRTCLPAGQPAVHALSVVGWQQGQNQYTDLFTTFKQQKTHQRT